MSAEVRPILRAVVDPNVFVASSLGSTTCRAVLSRIAEGAIVPITSPRLLADLRSLLARQKFHGSVTTGAIDELIHFIERHAVVLTPAHHVQISRDPDDNHLLSLALEGAVEVIVSGDKDVTSLNAFAGIPILTPRNFLVWLARR